MSLWHRLALSGPYVALWADLMTASPFACWVRAWQRCIETLPADRRRHPSRKDQR